MNKQELIKEFREVGIYNLSIFGVEIKGIPTESAIALIEQLDEPQPVKVPQCVHKYIQEAKEYNWDLQDLMKSIDDEDSKDLQRWFYHECNQETLARAWLDGYEVEEEKRYFVKVKATKHYISKDGIGKIFFSLAYKESFTKKELEEAGFGWVFDCPGIEIEEVE
ncbi:DUF1642 domain-containing protein [Streptococcus mitis]|uniref:DUF1642 domain-containing protein n=1 Tax=Streptococcus mitis TaxID=28037 RepID=UPI00129275F8|nr:DUF1642 domain-containing protein [Streptococcus mitis]MQQ66934.1 DUF1642 domain-containing protein [Streptococcus mitis]